MDPDDSNETRLSSAALNGLARSAIEAVLRQRAIRKTLWEERLTASAAAKALCGRLARTDRAGTKACCQYAEECVEQEDLPPLCPLREDNLEDRPT